MTFLFAGMHGGPMGENTFNPNIPPPNLPSNLNTPFNNNAQLNQSAVQGPSRKPNPPRAPIGNVLNFLFILAQHSQAYTAITECCPKLKYIKDKWL